MSQLPAFSQGGNIRTTLCAFKKSVQTPGADRWPQRTINSLQVLKQDVQQDPLLTDNQRQVRTFFDCADVHTITSYAITVPSR